MKEINTHEKIKILSLSFFISIIVFFIIYIPMISMSNPNIKVENIQLTISNYASNKEECDELDGFMTPVECDNYIASMKKNTKSNNINNYYFHLICFIIYITLFLQFYLFFKSKFYNVNFSDFYKSEWAINSPPMLGVLGTILAFSLLMGESANSDIKEIFSKHFFEAAITTILGGIVYVINLSLSVEINTQVEKLKNS